MINKYQKSSLNNKKVKTLILSLSLAVVFAGCNTPSNINNIQSELKTNFIKGKVNLSGKVEFPNKFNVKANQTDITANSTISLLYPTDYQDTNLRNTTLVGGSTTSTGDFSISFDPSVAISVGQTFILEATKRLGTNGNESISLRTNLMWDGTSFKSITNSGKIYINSKTTALSILSSSNTVLASDTIGKINVIAGVSQVSVVNSTITTSVINSVKDLVELALTNNQDPIAAIAFKNGRFSISKKIGQISSSLGECVGNPSDCPTIPTLPAVIPTVAPSAILPTPVSSGISEKIGGCIHDGLFCHYNQFLVSSESSSSGVSVAMKNNGDFISVWGENGAIVSQIYQASGEKIGSKFTVTSNGSLESAKSVAVDNDGNFVIVWVNYSNNHIYAKRFGSTAIPIGSEFQVNNGGYQYNGQASVDIDSMGNFVISWIGNQFPQSAIYAKKYNSSGTVLNSDITVTNTNYYTNSNQSLLSPSISIADDGKFIVSWQLTNNGIYAQRYDTSGLAVGTAIKLNTLSDTFFDGHIAIKNDGGFVVTWSHNYGESIVAREFDTTGQAFGTEFTVNTDLSSASRFSPNIVIGTDGRFVITWTAQIYDQNKYNILARQYNSMSVALGNEFKINEQSTDGAYNTSISMDGQNNFVVGWNAYNNQGYSSISFVAGRMFDSNGNSR